MLRGVHWALGVCIAGLPVPWLLALGLLAQVVMAHAEPAGAVRLATQWTPENITDAVALDAGRRLVLVGRNGLAGAVLTVHETQRGQAIGSETLGDRCAPGVTRAEADDRHLLLVTADGLLCRRGPFGEPVAELPHPIARAVSAAFARDGSALALGNGDGELAVLDWPSGRVRWQAKLPAPGGYVIDLAFSADGRALLVCCGAARSGGQGDLLVLDVASGRVDRQQPASGLALGVAADGRSVALLGDRLSVFSWPELKPLWEAPTNIGAPPRATPVGYIHRPTPLVPLEDGWMFSNPQRQLMHARPDGRLAARSSGSGAVLVERWSGAPAWVQESALQMDGRSTPLPAPLSATRPAIAVSPDQRWLLVSRGHRLLRFDLQHGFGSAFPADTGSMPSAVGINDEGQFIAWSSLGLFAGNQRGFSDRPLEVLRISDNGDTVLGRFSDGVHWRNLARGRTMALPRFREALALRGEGLVYKATSGMAHCASLASRVDRPLPFKLQVVEWIRLSPDGRQLARVADDDAIEVWSCESGKRTARIVPRSDGLDWLPVELEWVDGDRLLARSVSVDQAIDGRWLLGRLSTGEWQPLPIDLGDRVLAVGSRRVIGQMPDHSLRIAELPSGRWLASLSVHDDENWLVVAPEGHFDTARLQDNPLVRWVLPGQPLQPLPMEVFYRDYYEPDLLAKLWRGEPLRPLPALQSRNLQRPTVRILAVEPGGPGELSVELEVSASPQAGAQQLRLARDGVLVASLANWTAEPAADGLVHYRHRFSGIRLPAWRPVFDPAPLVFSAWAFNSDGVRGDTARQVLPAAGLSSSAPRRAFVLSIGVNRHDNPAWDLAYAVNDATVLSQSLGAALGAAGFQVQTASLLSDGPASGPSTAGKASIRDALLKLAGSLPADRPAPAGMANWPRPGPDDLVLITFAGHGFATPGGQFYLVPQDTGAGSGRGIDAALQARSIGMDELYGWLEGLDAGKVAIVLDACNSASAVLGDGFRPGPGAARSLGQLAYDKGISVLAAAAGDQSALEIGTLQHGLVTWVLAQEGLEGGKADAAPADRRITLSEWLRYAVARTPEVAARLARGLSPGGRGVVRPGGVAQLQSGPALQQPRLFDYGSREVVLRDLR